MIEHEDGKKTVQQEDPAAAGSSNQVAETAETAELAADHVEPAPAPKPRSEASSGSAPSVGDTSPSMPSVGETAPSIGDTAASIPGVAAPRAEKADSSYSVKVVGGLVSAVSAEEVALTLDDGRPAVIHRQEFDESASDPTTVLNVGDRAEGVILAREDSQNRVVLSRAWALKNKAWEAVTAAKEAGALLSGKVVSATKKGLVVDVGVRGFVPSSQVSLDPTKDFKALVGQTLEFKPIELDLPKERLVLSRRSILLKEQRKQVHDLIVGLKVGEKREGTVASIADYGAFIDLGGVTGLVHLSELSWTRVQHPKHAVAVGDTVEVVVLDVKVKRRRISLSIRQLTDDPFSLVPVGEVLTGPVTRLVDFGAFVDLNGVEGLVHLSELCEYRVSSPAEVVTPGEEIRVKVLSVDKKRRRIELSVRQAVSSEYG